MLCFQNKTKDFISEKILKKEKEEEKKNKNLITEKVRGLTIPGL